MELLRWLRTRRTSSTQFMSSCVMRAYHLYGHYYRTSARNTYQEMFSAMRAALVAKYGSTGRQRLFVTDFEIATINAINDFFPEATVKGCTFHFRQALIRHVADLGLRHAYSTDAEIQKWIRQIMGLSLLPAVFIPIAMQTLRHPPTHCGADLHCKMAEFSAYR